MEPYNNTKAAGVWACAGVPVTAVVESPSAADTRVVVAHQSRLPSENNQCAAQAVPRATAWSARDELRAGGVSATARGQSADLLPKARRRGRARTPSETPLLSRIPSVRKRRPRKLVDFEAPVQHASAEIINSPRAAKGLPRPSRWISKTSGSASRTGCLSPCSNSKSRQIMIVCRPSCSAGMMFSVPAAAASPIADAGSRGAEPSARLPPTALVQTAAEGAASTAPCQSGGKHPGAYRQCHAASDRRNGVVYRPRRAVGRPTGQTIASRLLDAST